MNLYGAQDYIDLGYLDQPFPVRGRWNFDMESKAIALFGQIEFDLSEHVGLIVGARVSDETKDFAQDYQISDPLGILGLGEVPDFTSFFAWPYSGKFEDTLYTGKLQLDWRPGDAHLLYASISRGQKVGGFNNGQIPFILEEDVPYESEQLMAYEIGWKGTMGGGRTRLNVSAFYYDYKDFQVFAFQNLGAITGNNDAKVTGGEIELASMPVGNLELSLGASFLDSTVYDVPSTNGTLFDMEMGSAPRYSVNGLVRYTWDIGSSSLKAQVDFVSSDEYYASAVNHPSLLLPSYTRTNARIGFGPQAGGWEISLWVRNLNNEENRNMAFPLADFFGMTQMASTPPRQIGATLDFRF
jgi:iron complex outermembrane receptor protein